ncbi:hypothetical protein [Mucilaginibacter sp.]|jgi:hypothetical protein|uniref:hypothetical protein n=1 Tax=Mucilaginibacter sp. TaxID=1882438 RepID=UPI0035616F63
MSAADKHYKFINSRTGYVIFYHSLNACLSADEVKAELEKIKAQVAIQNRIYQETIYWEEIKDDETPSSLGSL